jgi:oligopeptide transport system substrate-binding protein
MKLTKMFQKLYLQNGLQFILITFISCFFSCYSKPEINKQVFAYNESTGIATLDPAFAKNQSVIWAVHQLYNTLVELDTNLQIKPSVAKSWNISNDGLIYTFHLRKDIYFQDNPAFVN